MILKITKPRLTIVILSVIVLVFTACDNKKTGKTEKPKSDSIIIVEEIRDIKDFGTYTYEQKDDVVSYVKTELDTINRKISDLKLKTELENKQKKWSAEIKSNYENALKELEKNRDDFEAKITVFEISTEEIWENAKANIADAYNTVALKTDSVYNKVKSTAEDTVFNMKHP